MAAVYENLIHTWQRGIGSHLNNRFLTKCRDIFFPPEPKEALRYARFRSPRQAVHRSEAAQGPVQSIREPIRHRWRPQRVQSPGRVRLRGKDYVDPARRYMEDSRQ